MAINTYRFWMATDANRLLANQNAFIQASAPSFYQGNVAQLELHIVASAGVGTSPIEVPFPAGAAISVAVGDTNTYPTGGTWELMVEDVETEPVPYNATTTQVAAALNALTSVSTAGGVTVSKTGEGYTITWNTYGLKPTIGIGSDTLTPSSYESISLVQEGNAERRQIVFVELRQNPIALSTTWTALPTPSVTVLEVQAWNGTNRIWRVSIDPQPKAGSITISYGSKTATLSYSASVSSIAAALSPAQVFATGQYQWDIAILEDSVLTASGSLVGYNGYSGSINFATAECHQFLAGAERKATVLEVSISVDSKRYTLIQVPCNVFADVVSDGVLVPLTLGTAISEQVANARFVRRDIEQNPDTSTQDVIWQNLGVETLGSDVVGALNNADSPSSANPFVTQSDISGIGAVWGSITGTLSSQTDLVSALDDKYDASNPDGYLNATTGLSYFYPATGNPGGFATQAWVIGQNYLTASSLDSYATQSWVTSQGYITASALSPYLTSATAASTYQTISGMSSYLTTSTAASTYAVIARGLPSSGTTGQVLSKASGTNYDVTWTSITPGDRYLTTSTTINTIGNGVKTFTVGTGLSYTTQQDVTIAFNDTHHMHALVTSYNAGTGVLVVDVSNHTGTGTYSTWTVNVGGTVPLASVAWGGITGTLGDQSDLATELSGKLSLTGGSLSGQINVEDGSYNAVLAYGGLTVTQAGDYTGYLSSTGIEVYHSEMGSYGTETISGSLSRNDITSSFSGYDSYGSSSHYVKLSHASGFTGSFTSVPASGNYSFTANGITGSQSNYGTNSSFTFGTNGVEWNNGSVYGTFNSSGIRFADGTTQSTAATSGLSAPPYYTAVWAYGGWYSANVTNIMDGNYTYWNVITV